MHRSDEERSYRPVWREQALTDLERRWSSVWQPQPHTGITSALFCIQPVFLHDPTGTRYDSGNWARHLQLACSPTADTPTVLTWCSGLRPGQIGAHFEALGLAAPGTTRTDEAGANYATMMLDGATLEMHRRHLCTQCQTDRTFSPARLDCAAA